MGNEVATRGQPGDVEQFTPGAMLLALEGKGPFPVVDTQAIRQRINQQLLEATTPDELIAAGKADAIEQLLGRPLEVHAAVPRPSKFEGEGLEGFLIMDVVTLDDGAHHIVTTSAENVCIRVAIAADRDWLPIRFKVRKAEKPTERGFYPLIVESV